MGMIKQILLCLIILSLSACEEIIPLESELKSDRITLSAVVTPDTVVYAFITEAYDLDYFETIKLRSDYYDYDKVLYPRNQMFRDTIAEKTILKNANVELVVNDAERYPMYYDSLCLTYNSSYVPKYGDKINIRVDSMTICDEKGVRKHFDKAEAVAMFPSTTPKIEILEKKLSYKEREYYTVIDVADTVAITDYWGADTVMTVKIKIKDPGNEKNYYRLLVRSVGASRLYAGSYSAAYPLYLCVDEFKSKDLLFYDSDLVKPYGYLPAYFSNVFDDELINGKEYEFTVETRMRRASEITPYVIIELQNLSPDLYYYLKDIEVFRINDFDLYDNPIQINCNVTGGWGVLGAMTYDTHMVPFK